MHVILVLLTISPMNPSRRVLWNQNVKTIQIPQCGMKQVSRNQDRRVNRGRIKPNRLGMEFNKANELYEMQKQRHFPKEMKVLMILGNNTLPKDPREI